jgi:hypothetical protein
MPAIERASRVCRSIRHSSPQEVRRSRSDILRHRTPEVEAATGRAALPVLRARTHGGTGNRDASRGIDHRTLDICRQARRGWHVRDPERHQTDRHGHRQGEGHDASHRVSSDVPTLEARNRPADRAERVFEVRDRPSDRAKRVSEAPYRPSDRASGSTLQARNRSWDRAERVSNVPDRPSDRLHGSSPSSCIDVRELPAVAGPRVSPPSSGHSPSGSQRP